MKNICVVLNKNQPKYSETFLQAHIDHFATVVVNIYDYFPPTNQHTKGNSSYRTLLRTIQYKIRHYRLKQFLKNHRIELVLAEYGFVGALMVNVCRELDLPLVVHFHGYDAYRKDILARYDHLYVDMFAYAKALIAVSNDMQQQLLTLGASSNKVYLNVYGVDIKLFSASYPKSSLPHLLFVGRFVDKKAPYLTILAFQKALSSVPEAKLTMVGDGPLLDVCEKIVRSYRLERSIKFKQKVSHEEVSSLMQRARAYVQHSLVPASGDSEGTPVVILEAGASGLPVISTRHAGIQDVVIHNETGFLVEEHDIEAMSQYMVVLLTDATRAQSMGTNARAFIAKHYSIQNSLDRLHEIITAI